MSSQIAIWTPPASTTAVRVDLVCLFLFVICTAVGLLVASLLIGFCVRYRRRPADRGNPPAYGGHFGGRLQRPAAIVG